MSPRNPPHDALNKACSTGTPIVEQTDPRAAFDIAIASGRLSADATAPNFAGHYMFMGNGPDGRLLFKHRDTREYIA